MLKINSNNLLDYTLRDRITGNLLEGATVTAQITHDSGTVVVEEFAMADIGDGVYRYDLPAEDSEVFKHGQIYAIEVTSIIDEQKLYDVEKQLAL